MARKLPRSGLLAAPLAGVALVLSLGARTLPAPDGSWLGVLPASAFIVGVLVASVAAALAWGVATRRWPFLAAWPAAAWSGLLLAALPWLPLPLPAARFVWLGPLAWLAWAGAVATGVACMTAGRPAWPCRARDGGPPIAVAAAGSRGRSRSCCSRPPTRPCARSCPAATSRTTW